MEDSFKETGLSFSLFQKQVNDDFFELIRGLPSRNVYVTAPPYLMNYIRNAFAFKQNKWLNLTSYDEVKQSNGSAELIIIVPAERSNVDSALDKFELVPNYIKCLLIIPRITAVVQQALDYRKIKAVQHPPKNPSEIYVQEFHYDFFPVDDDFFLLPCYHSFYQINVENDYNDVYSSARALAKIQTVFGEIPHIVSIGKIGLNTKNLMQGLLRKTGSLSTQYPLIDSIFLFDRACDLVTPLASQVTFEGIIDECVGVSFGICKTDDKKYELISLSGKYDVVSEIRGKLVRNAMEPLLNFEAECKKYKDQEYLNSCRSNMADFAKLIAKLRHLNSQKDKIDELLYLAHNYFKKRIDDPFSKILLDMEFSAIAQDQIVLPATAESAIQFFNDWKTALRLILLQLVVNNSAIDSQLLYETLIDQFGPKAKDTIRSIDRLDLFKTDRKTSHQYRTNNAVLSLTTPKDKSMKKDKNSSDELLDMCDNVIPLMLRIIQFLTSNDQQTQSKLNDLGFPIEISGKLPPSVPGKPRKILIFFIGGITLSEVNFIRNFGKIISNNRFQFIIGSTDQINSNIFIEQLCPGLFDD